MGYVCTGDGCSCENVTKLPQLFSIFFLPAGNTEIGRTKILTSISHFCNSFISVRLFHLQEPWRRSKEFDKKKRRSIIQQLLKETSTFFPHVTNQRASVWSKNKAGGGGEEPLRHCRSIWLYEPLVEI